MLNIEVIKFEAQDVITTSVAAPTEEPTEPPRCACDLAGCNLSNANTVGGPRNHYLEGTFYQKCTGLDGTGVHTCENKGK